MESLVQILQLPERSLVSKRITKVFFKRNFDLTLTERKLLEDFSTIIQIDWLASLKPNNVNIEGYNQDQITVEEIQVISVLTSEDEFGKYYQKIVDLIQKFIPYHILVCVYNTNEFVLQTCNKRVNLNDSSRRTIEQCFITEPIAIADPNDKQQAFLASLAFGNLDKHDLKTLFDTYSQSIVALQTATITGSYTNRPIERSLEDVNRLATIKKLENDIQILTSQAKKETQLNLQVKINAEVQQKRIEIDDIKQKLIT